MKSSVCIALVVLLAAAVTSAEILNVPSPYGSITAAAESAFDGDTVLVAPGLYEENIRITGKSIVIASNFLFDSSASSVLETVIDGSGPINPDHGSAIAVLGSASSGTAIVGLTLRGGVGTFLGNKYAGGGILITDASNTYIAHNVIRNNNATRGGGVAAYGCSSTIMGNVIMQNHSTYGGGIDLDDSPVIVQRNALVENDASIAGGAANVSNSQVVVFTDNIIYQNSAAEGAGIAANSSELTVVFNDFWNSAGPDISGCDPAIGDTNCCLNYNGIPCDAFSNIFRYPGVTCPTESTAFRVDCSSDLIDAGSAPNLRCPFGGTRTDIGPYEYPYLVGDIYVDSEVDITDVVYLIDYVFLFVWSPCPRWSGDWNGDRRVNSVDLAQLISYIFRNGRRQNCGNE